jgi:hypothetical protein
VLGEYLGQYAKDCRIVVNDHNVAHLMVHVLPLVAADSVSGLIFGRVVIERGWQWILCSHVALQAMQTQD